MAGSAPDRDGVPAWIAPMLAKPAGPRLPGGPDWVFEYKLDGYRVAMRLAAGTTVLTSRNGLDLTDEFGSLVGVLDQALDGRAAVFDGEIVAYDENGLVDFGLMQERRGRYQKHRKSAPPTSRSTMCRSGCCCSTCWCSMGGACSTSPTTDAGNC
ncbi:hypothetical protein GCM10029964_065850 [Kibdelosporangium lantanae]